MPKLVRKLSAEDYRRRGAGVPKLNLTPYTDILQGMSTGEGAEVALDEGERQRVVKRRFSMAAGQMGHAVRWKSAKEGHLRFQLIPKPEGKTAR